MKQRANRDPCLEDANNTVKRQGLIREDGSLVSLDKRVRDVLKRQGQEGGDDEDSEEMPHQSIQDQLNALEEGQEKLHRDFEGLGDSVHRHQQEQQTFYTGIMKFMSCWGRKHGAINEDLAHLDIHFPTLLTHILTALP
ncbi:hypothetical protein LIER_06967 [Lithospermum erythrorhizon]|uniref:Uncharacterized protein n=1 Tax=Lithospermum erythrorhizon TaxID=34254 RepID=A0AAV3P6S0_LITER